jgi:RNA polymerase sigma-70 factor, ECF subfamily
MKILPDEVIAMLNKKHEAAFEVAFSLYYPRLVHFAQVYVSEEDAKNAVQDAFVSYWERKPQMISEYQFQSYLYTAVKNNCLMMLRHEKVKKNFNDNVRFRIQNQLYTGALEELNTSVTAFQEIEAIIENTLSEMPDRCREIFLLSRFKGKKNHEIASEMNITEKAVEAHITKALKLFRIALKDFLPLLAIFFISGR